MTIIWMPKVGTWETTNNSVRLLTGVSSAWSTIWSNIEERQIKRIEFETYAQGSSILTRVNGGNSVCYQISSTAVWRYLNGSTASTNSYSHSYGSTDKLKISIDFTGTKNIFKINDNFLFEDDLTTYAYGVIGFGSYNQQPTNITNLKVFLRDKMILENPTTNQNYSLADNTLIHLPNSSNKSMILFGMEQGKEIALNVPFNKKNYVNDTPVGKVFTQGIESSNTLKTKELKKDYTPIFTWNETKMTSNIAPTPLVASASSEFNTTLQAWKAFNGTTTDLNDAWITTSGVTNGWVQINYGRPIRLNAVMMLPRNYTDFNLSSPKDFNILGSNNGDSFDLLKEIRGQNDWKQNVSKHFLFENEKEYMIYRLEVLNTNGMTSVAIGEILFGYKREVN